MMNKIYEILKRFMARSFIRFLLTVAGIVVLVYLFASFGLWIHSK